MLEEMEIKNLHVVINILKETNFRKECIRKLGTQKPLEKSTLTTGGT